MAAFDQAQAGRRRRTLEDCAQAIVEVTLSSHHLTPDLHRIVLDLAPRIGVEDETRSVCQTLARAVEHTLRQHTDEIAPEVDIATATLIIETLLEALAHRAVTTRPELGQGDIAAEATRLIIRYLANA